jgi:hypothetical protein
VGQFPPIELHSFLRKCPTKEELFAGPRACRRGVFAVEAERSLAAPQQGQVATLHTRLKADVGKPVKGRFRKTALGQAQWSRLPNMSGRSPYCGRKNFCACEKWSSGPQAGVQPASQETFNSPKTDALLPKCDWIFCRGCAAAFGYLLRTNLKRAGTWKSGHLLPAGQQIAAIGDGRS